MKKDTKDIKKALVGHRLQRASEMAKEVEESQVINPDVENDVYAGLYSKGMTHNPTTLVADEKLIKELQIAMKSGEQKDFDDLDKAGVRKQVSPQAALSFENMGGDPMGFDMPAPPALSSRHAAADMVEVYEMAVLRDKSFAELNGDGPDATIDGAVASLNAFGSDFKGPKDNGLVTRKLLFRGLGPKEDVGPYVSQLLLHPVTFGAHSITQKYVARNGEYGYTEANYLAIQNGNVPVPQVLGDLRYCATPRDLGSIVHVDFVYQQFLYAALILMGRPRQAAFPVLPKEDRFVTNGGPVDLGCAVTEVARHALKATWNQKWHKHLRLRPEAMAARVVKEKEGVLPAGTVHADLINSDTLAAVEGFLFNKGVADPKVFLPMQVAEGSPLHPSYPAGHAAIAGACATIIKLYIADGAWSSTGLAAVHSLDGSTLVNYTEADASQMTIHGELNKIASNVALGRNMCGVHFRSDGDEGVKLGEKVAIKYFKDMKAQQNEAIGQVSLVKFDGTVEIV